MRFKVVDIHSDADVHARGFPGFVTVRAEEEITLGPNQIGTLHGKKSHHDRGVFFQGGIINPGWSGHLTIELVVFGELRLAKGDEVAHAVIFTEE